MNVIINQDKPSSSTFSVKPEELKLLSIRKAGKILGIRYEHMLELLRKGRVKSIKIGKREKIPYISLVEFIKSETGIALNRTVIRNASGKTHFNTSANRAVNGIISIEDIYLWNKDISHYIN